MLGAQGQDNQSQRSQPKDFRERGRNKERQLRCFDHFTTKATRPCPARRGSEKLGKAKGGG